MSVQKNDAKKAPSWQEISGINPENEATLSADARDEGIRKLLREVDVMARAEFARGANVPAGERTIFWEPLERVCSKLGISRVKLSAFSRELTGLRAHELTDRIKAESLPKLLEAQLRHKLGPALQFLRNNVDRENMDAPQYQLSWALRFWKQLKKERAGAARVRWAAELGFPNPSRLSRACLITHGMSIEDMEGNLVIRIVQKFFDELLKDLPQRTQRAQREDKKGETAKTRHENAMDEADAIIKDAANAVARGLRDRVA